jgi:hypothetical protein
MKKLAVVIFSIALTLGSAAQTGTPQTSPAKAQNPAAQAAADISGMYTFLKEGEFVQITVEEQAPPAPTPQPDQRLSAHRPDRGNVSGFVSRFGDGPGDKGAFLDQFIEKGTLDGNKLNFVTAAVHGVVYKFSGTVERGPGKTPEEEAYRVLRGTLTVTSTDAEQKSTSRDQNVQFRSFPRNAMADTPTRN